jgi:hypothetical protein
MVAVGCAGGRRGRRFVVARVARGLTLRGFGAFVWGGRVGRASLWSGIEFLVGWVTACVGIGR